MVFAPFLLLYTLIALVFLAAIFILIQVQVISYAFSVLGLSPRAAVFALLASLIGSYVNIPLYSVPAGETPATETVSNFGVVYTIPFEYGGPTTTVAINVGGAVVPVAISLYALARTPVAVLPALLGTAIVAVVTHHFAYPLRGVGIGIPMFIPPLVAALAALLLGKVMGLGKAIHIIAYVSGVLGTLIGADLWNLHKIADLGAPVASIGGAGTFDGVFLTGIVAVLIAGF